MKILCNNNCGWYGSGRWCRDGTGTAEGRGNVGIADFAAERAAGGAA